MIKPSRLLMCSILALTNVCGTVTKKKFEIRKLRELLAVHKLNYQNVYFREGSEENAYLVADRKNII